MVTAEIGAKLAGARPKSPISRAVLYYGRAALDLHGANFPDRRDLMKPPAKRALEAAEDPSRSGEERLASACERWAARVAVARRARMRWFNFSQLARTSLEWPWRAPKTSLGAVMSAVAIVGTSSIGPAPLAHRAATLVARMLAHAYRHSTVQARRCRQKRAYWKSKEIGISADLRTI